MKMLLLPLAISAVLISYGWSQDTAKNHADQPVTMPANSPYEKISVEEILDKNDDPELVKLSGEIIKKLKCSTYLFRDETGEIKVHIPDEDIPEKGLLFNSPMTIKGQIEPAANGIPVKVEADKVRYFF